MKCAICGGKTNWDSSFGYNEFIVCWPCYNRLAPGDDEDALNFIFTCGQIRRDKKKEKENLK